jgi:hypothetical protein
MFMISGGVFAARMVLAEAVDGPPERLALKPVPEFVVLLDAAFKEISPVTPAA